MGKRGNTAEWFQKGLDALAMSWTADYQSEAKSDREDALAAFDQAINLRPDHADAWFQKGVVLEHLERCEEALGSIEQFLRLRPDDAEGWLHKARALAQLARPAEALAACEQTLRRHPGDLEAWFRKASALDELARPEEALHAWEEVLRPCADDRKPLCWHLYFHVWESTHLLTARFRRGDALARLGRREEALAAYREAIQLGKGNLHGPLSPVGFRDSLREFAEARQAYAEVQASPAAAEQDALEAVPAEVRPTVPAAPRPRPIEPAPGPPLPPWIRAESVGPAGAARGRTKVSRVELTCKYCYRPAGSVVFVHESGIAAIEGVQPPGGTESAIRIVVPPEQREVFVRSIRAGAAALFSHDERYVTGYCPECDASYCMAHWTFDEAPLKTCPAGHIRRVVDI